MNRLVLEKAENSTTIRTTDDDMNGSRIYLQKELEQVGIAKEVIEKNRPYFVKWLAAAITENRSPDPTLDKMWKGPFEEAIGTCIYCDSDEHQSKQCECLDVFDPKPPPSQPEPMPIPCRGAPSTHSQSSGSSIRRGSATLPYKSKTGFASSFGMETNTVYGFSPASGMQFAPPPAPPKSISSVDSNSIHDQTRSRNGSVATEPDGRKRRGFRSSISSRFGKLGSSAPSVYHGLSP